MTARKPLDVPALAAAYTAGASIRALARRHGVSPVVIHRRLRGARVQMRPVGGPPGGKTPPKVRQDIADGYAAGTPMADLVARYRLSDQTIREIAAAAGVPLRLPGARKRLDRAAIVSLDGQGWPADAIAVMVGGSVHQVRKILREFFDRQPAAG
ncbi:hypothetical protein SAMN05421505_12028 [Sinosporangium album]|uniref:Helix-turn-helix domain-containing protein n=1 Tax=Sinosporangium album TaxID=504805 RepID=A0A1G8EBP5_9ACTN|nr:hypothetical protein [Sinosporangium album]SDH67311.1 hypothetical protein SAMN05421505_12028 [Sinosporangium album]